MIVPAAMIASVVSRIGFILRPPFAHRRLGISASRLETAPLDDKSSPKARKYLRYETAEVMKGIRATWNLLGNPPKKLHSHRKRGSLQNWGMS
jgi:hypothetical protein